MRYLFSRKAFTLIEIMLVMAMIGILAAAMFYMGGPYLNRSRDVARFTDISQYGRVLDLYYKDHDTIPSNDASVWAYGYCADEVFFERTNVAKNPDQQFEELAKLMGGTPPRDPLKSTLPIGPCTRTGSYLYSSFIIGTDRYSLLGTQMGIASNGNYLTWSDVSPGTGAVALANIDKMQATYKGTISDTTQGNRYYFIATKY